MDTNILKKAFPNITKPVTLVPRNEWGALPSREMVPLEHPIGSVVFAYNTEEPVCRDRLACIEAVKRLQKKHMDMGLADIYYNFLVGGDGIVYEGRGWNFRHSKSANFPLRYGIPVVIGIIGDGKGFDEWRPPYEVVAPGMNLVKKGIREKYVIELYNVFEDLNKIEGCVMPGC